MARVVCNIGFATSQGQSGVYKNNTEERTFTGLLYKQDQRWKQTQNANDDIALNYVISIISTADLIKNSSRIKYVRLNGTAWKVSSIEIIRPRIKLMIGEIYNGPTISAPVNA
jgi:hypothetical protein